MKKAYKLRPSDFKRRILVKITTSRKDLLIEENKWLSLIRAHELKIKYYNVHNHEFNHWSANEKKKIEVGQKITNANTGRKQNFADPKERARKISQGKKKMFVERGYTFTKEHREKLRNNKLGTVHTNEAKLKTSNSIKASWDNPEVRLKRSTALKLAWAKKRENINNIPTKGIKVK